MTQTRLAHDWYDEPLPPNVVMGPGSWLYSSYAFRHCRSEQDPAVEIGRNSGIYLGSHFDLGPEGSVVIGDDCTLVSVILATNGRVEIGSLVLIAHDVVISGESTALPGRGRGGTHVRIGDNVWICTRSVLLDGADIGDDSVVAAGAVVDFAVPSGSVVGGNPAAIVQSLR